MAEPVGRGPHHRLGSGWSDFVPQTLANTVAILLAAMISYLSGVALGLVRATWWIFAVIGLLVAGFGLRLVQFQLADNFGRSRIRSEAVFLLLLVLTSLPQMGVFVLVVYLLQAHGVSIAPLLRAFVILLLIPFTVFLWIRWLWRFASWLATGRPPPGD